MPRNDIRECDIDMTAIMDAECIRTVHRWSAPINRASVILVDGRVGIGQTVGQAFAAALRDNRPRLAA